MASVLLGGDDLDTSATGMESDVTIRSFLPVFVAPLVAGALSLA